ncbi:MAG: polysaccharide deacetylase family protein [Proteobacteria bacterium]|nr:polysaccharide deacetylase family protein [Pseudomonadota bacterium]
MSLMLLCGHAQLAFSSPDIRKELRPNIGSLPIYLFNSKPTRDYFASVGGNYDLILKPWRDFFQSRGAAYSEIQNGELKPDLKPGVLILPSVVALDPADNSAIQAFEKAGGSIIATWATGARNGNAKWLGYDFLNEQFGIKVSGEITRKNKDKDNFLVIFGETPVAHSLPAGSRIWFDQINILPMQITGGANVAGRFLDVANTPGTQANEAIVYTETGASRRAYFAFSETLWQFQQNDIYSLLDDTLDWLRRRPSAYLANWPYPYRSAQIVEMDTELGFPNALRLANMLDSNGLQGSFYCLTSIAARHPDILKQLEGKHELAYHGDVHESFKGQSGKIQSQRLDAMRHDIESMVTTPASMTGFRPPYELYDQTTESLLFEKGYGHLLVDSYGSRAMLPYLASASPKDFLKGLIVLPRTHRGDMDFGINGAAETDMSKAMNDDLDQTLEIGSLGVLSLHSENFEAGSAVIKATGALLTHIKQVGNKIWVAPGGKVTAWWRERSLIKFNFTADTLQLNITIAKPGLSRNASIVISNPVRGAAPRIVATKAGMPSALTVPMDDYSTAVILNTSAPGKYSYNLNYH